MAYRIKDADDQIIKAPDSESELIVTDHYDIDMKELDETERSFFAVASEESPDRDGDILSIKGWKLDNYLKAPMGLFAHDYHSVPIFKSVNTFVKGKKLIINPKFDDDDFSKLIFDKYRKGFLTSFSVGFIGLEWDDLDEEKYWGPRKYTEQELLEVSCVPVPCHPNAQALMKEMQKGDAIYIPKRFVEEEKTTTIIELDKEEESKDAVNEVDMDEPVVDSKDIINPNIAFKELPIGDKEQDWNIEKVLEEATIDDLKVISAWYDPDNSNTKEAYLFQHHNVDNYFVNYKGIVDAMRFVHQLMLLDPDNAVDLKDVHDHLIAHCWQYEWDGTEFKVYSEEELAEILPVEKEDGVVNPKVAVEVDTTVLDAVTVLGDLVKELSIKVDNLEKKEKDVITVNNGIDSIDLDLIELEKDADEFSLEEITTIIKECVVDSKKKYTGKL